MLDWPFVLHALIVFLLSIGGGIYLRFRLEQATGRDVEWLTEGSAFLAEQRHHHPGLVGIIMLASVVTAVAFVCTALGLVAYLLGLL